MACRNTSHDGFWRMQTLVAVLRWWLLNSTWLIDGITLEMTNGALNG